MDKNSNRKLELLRCALSDGIKGWRFGEQSEVLVGFYDNYDDRNKPVATSYWYEYDDCDEREIWCKDHWMEGQTVTLAHKW